MKIYILITAIFFSIAAIIHLLRLINGWPAQIGTFEIPIAVSVFGLVLAGILSISGFNLYKKIS